MTSNIIRTDSWKRWALGLCMAIAMFSAGCSLVELSEQAQTSAAELAPLAGLGPKDNIGS